jgi:hypothetical protein
MKNRIILRLCSGQRLLVGPKVPESFRRVKGFLDAFEPPRLLVEDKSGGQERVYKSAFAGRRNIRPTKPDSSPSTLQLRSGQAFFAQGGQSMFSQVLIVSQLTTPFHQPLH